MKDINERISDIVIPNGLGQAESYLKKHLDCLILFNYRFRQHLDDLYLDEARLFSHVVFSKGLNILKLLEGVSYRSKFVDLDKIIDPLSIAVLVRNIYETTGLFNLIYRAHRGEDSKLIYLLWKASGLKYRQNFSLSDSSPETLSKIHNEAEQLRSIEEEIKNNSTYIGFEEESKKIINRAFRKKEYQFIIRKNHPKFVPWRVIGNIMGFKREHDSKIYSFLSLYAHPSNVSIFQFDQLFRKDTMEFKGMSSYMINLASWLISVFIADFVNLFPQTLQYFNELKLEDQVIVDFANRLKRDNKYSINDSYKSLS